MIFIDSCILIYLLEATPDKRRIVAGHFRQHATNSFCTSMLTRLECLVVPTRQNNSKLIDRYQQLFSKMLLLGPSADIFDQALKLRAFII